MALHFPVLELAISPKSSRSFYWGTKRETKIWIPGVLVAVGVVQSRSQLTEQGKQVYITLYIHIPPSIYSSSYYYVSIKLNIVFNS